MYEIISIREKIISACVGKSPSLFNENNCKNGMFQNHSTNNMEGITRLTLTLGPAS